MSKKRDNDAEAVKYISAFLVFLLFLITLYFLYIFVDKTFALFIGVGLTIVLIIFFAKKDTMNTVKTTLELSNENNKAMAEVEKYRQQAQIVQLKTFQEVLKGDNRVRAIEQKQEVRVLDKQPDFDRRLLTVNDRLLLTDSTIDDGDFRIIEE